MRALQFIRDHVSFKLPYDFSYQMKTPHMSYLMQFTKLSCVLISLPIPTFSRWIKNSCNVEKIKISLPGPRRRMQEPSYKSDISTNLQMEHFHQNSFSLCNSIPGIIYVSQCTNLQLNSIIWFFVKVERVLVLCRLRQ